MSGLKFVQYVMDTVYHRGIRNTPYYVHFGRSPPYISADVLLPTEVVESVEFEDDLVTALEQRLITEYPSQASLLETITSDQQPPFTPTLLSSLNLDEPFELSSGQQDTGSTFFYSPVPATESDQASNRPAHTSGDETEPDTGPPSPILEPLLIEDEDSYDLTVPPLIGSQHTPYTSHNPPPPVYSLVKGEILIISLAQLILFTNRSGILTARGDRIKSSPAW